MYKTTFLTAEWRKLAFANYVIEPSLLTPFLPAGTTLDRRDNKCYVSLVGFMFMNTEVKGLRIPFHVNFEEVNLRFYVQREEDGELKRGVTFIKEIVSKPALSFFANTLYNEKYVTLPMKHRWTLGTTSNEVTYEWKHKNRWNQLKVISSAEAIPIVEGSEEHFITEHFWGYSKINERSSTEYHLEHPSWQMYPIKDFNVDVDFAGLYGDAFSFLTDQLPASVMLAEGSGVEIFQERRKISKVNT